MSWGRKPWISKVDAALEFINTGSLAYNLVPVAGATRVGCIDSSNCGSGWKCQRGYCVPDDGRGGGCVGGQDSGCGDGVGGCGGGGGGGGSSCPPGGSGGASSGGGIDGCNKAGCGGFSGGGGGNADDCCGQGRCCRIGAGFVQCFCGDCPDPPSCDEFCSGYKAANGETAPGCGGEDGCDECSRCVNQGNFQGGKCEPISNGPCWCEKSACRDCEKCTKDGTCIEDCRTCETCVTMYNHPCPCGYATLKCCWSACNGTPNFSECALEGCKKAGLSDCGPPKCEDCTSVSRCDGLPCPDGYTQKGEVCVGDDCCVICEKCEPTGDPRCGCTSHAECPDCSLCGADGECHPDPNCYPYFNEIGWAYLAREQVWIYDNATQSCSSTDVEYEPSGEWPFDGNVHIYRKNGIVGTDAIGRTWQVANTVTVTSNMTGLGCGEPASAELVEMHLVNTDGTIASGSTVVNDPKVVAGSSSFRIETWVFGVVVGYGETSEEATINARAQIPGLS